MWERMDQGRRARIDALIAEFGGEADASAAPRMAEEILYWRKRMELISEVVSKVRTESRSPSSPRRRWHISTPNDPFLAKFWGSPRTKRPICSSPGATDAADGRMDVRRRHARLAGDSPLCCLFSH